jgi:hypothetical protein
MGRSDPAFIFFEITEQKVDYARFIGGNYQLSGRFGEAITTLLPL